MLTEDQRIQKLDAIQKAATEAAKKYKKLPHNYARKGKGKAPGKRKSQHKSRTRPSCGFKTNMVRPPNPYKPGSTYYNHWNDVFVAACR